MLENNDHMVIPDAHTSPGVNNDRFELAGKFALDHRPSTIVCLGDFASMDALSSYDKGHKSFEGKRYSKDVEVTLDALDRFEAPIAEYNRGQKKNRKVQYKPKKIMLLGNHENRINRAVELSPELDGSLSTDDLGYASFGWDVIPYLKMIEIDGVWYNHYFISGIMGSAISGINAARAIMTKHMASATAGHSHLFDYAIQSGPNGRKYHGLIAGCFFEHSCDYAKAVEHLWWRGLVLKKNVVDGDYDLQQYSMERLWRKYG